MVTCSATTSHQYARGRTRFTTAVWSTPRSATRALRPRRGRRSARCFRGVTTALTTSELSANRERAEDPGAKSPPETRLGRPVIAHVRRVIGDPRDVLATVVEDDAPAVLGLEIALEQREHLLRQRRAVHEQRDFGVDLA